MRVRTGVNGANFFVVNNAVVMGFASHFLPVNYLFNIPESVFSFSREIIDVVVAFLFIARQARAAARPIPNRPFSCSHQCLRQSRDRQSTWSLPSQPSTGVAAVDARRRLGYSPAGTGWSVWGDIIVFLPFNVFKGR